MGASDFTTKDSGERAQFDSGMQRDTEAGKPRFDLMLPLNVPYDEQMITRLAALYGRGAVKYDERNWEQANSEAEMSRMKSSAFRHFAQWIAGETDEDHAAAVMFNIIAFETTAYKVQDREEFDALFDDLTLPGPTASPAKTAGDELWDAVRKASKTPEPDGSDCQEIVVKTVNEWLAPLGLAAVFPSAGGHRVTRGYFETDILTSIRTRPMTSLEVARANGLPY